MTAFHIDLNCDLGEGVSAAAEHEILLSVTSANVACGLHAGDPSVMQQTVHAALARRLAIGAHPGLPDREGFGRQEVKLSGRDAFNLVLYQIGALDAIVRAEHGTLGHVKPHGALYHMATRDPEVAAAIVNAVRSFDPRLVVVGFPGGELLRAARAAGLGTAAEAFADRTYQPDGSLTPRSQPGALVDDIEQAATQALAIARDGTVRTATGAIRVQADTLCIHGDSPLAAVFARAIRERLESGGVHVAPLKTG